MKLCLAKSVDTQELLKDKEFRQKWTVLFEKCPWATVFQDAQYLNLWNRNYQEVCESFLIYETDANDELIGLFPLSRCLKTGKIFVMGDYHSEYQTWLATPENGNAFADKAFEIIGREFPQYRLQIMFLAPGTPLDWLNGKWARRTTLQVLQRPIVKLDGENTSAKSLKKKGNKSRIRQLKKRGELSFSEVDCPKEFDALFDEMQNYSDLRVSGIHNVQIKKDENRKAFHLDLMNETNVIYPTVLKVDQKLASAQVCFRNRDEMLLCITAMSPFYAKQSPSKIHLLKLGNLLFEQGEKNFDLSPGDGYKNRFATDLEKTHALTIFFTRKDYLRYKAKRRVVTMGRRFLEKIGLQKTRVYGIGDKIFHKLKRVQLKTVPKTILKNLGRLVYEYKEVRMYSFDVSDKLHFENPKLMSVDSVSDLLKYRPTEAWQDTTSQFHQKVLNRFEQGIHSYSYAKDGKLVHYGWLRERQEVSTVIEVGQSFQMPKNTAVLFDYFTDSAARGKGLYQKAILQGLHDAAKIPETEQVFIGVEADNKPSRHVIEKLGFKYEGSLFRETQFGFKKKWQVWEKDSPLEEKEAELNESYST